MTLIAWLVCVSIAGALLYVGLNAIAGLREACTNATLTPAPEAASSAGNSACRNGDLSKGITILPPNPRHQPNGHYPDHAELTMPMYLEVGPRRRAASVPGTGVPDSSAGSAAAPTHQVERNPKSRKPGHHA